MELATGTASHRQTGDQLPRRVVVSDETVNNRLRSASHIDWTKCRRAFYNWPQALYHQVAAAYGSVINWSPSAQ